MFTLFKNLFGKLSIKLDLSKRNSPSSSGSINNSPSSQINTAGRDINQTNVNSTETISDLERKILYRLHKEYKETGRCYCWKVDDAHKEIGVKEGGYVGHLSKSQFFKLDGECYVISDHGIRFMDSYIKEGGPHIDVVERGTSTGYSGWSVNFRLKNVGKSSAKNIRVSLIIDDLRPIFAPKLPDLQNGQEMRQFTEIYYRETTINEGTKNMRLIIKYEDEGGYEFSPVELSLIKTRGNDGRYRLRFDNNQ